MPYFLFTINNLQFEHWARLNVILNFGMEFSATTWIWDKFLH